MSKTIYEMSQEELAEFSPSDFTEAYLKSHAPLVDEWSNTTWFKDNWTPFPGKNAKERDLAKAQCIRVMQNYVDQAYPARRTADGVKHVKISEAMADLIKKLPDGGKLPETSLEFGEAATVAQTSAWSGATLLPLVLGYARKIMPKMYAQQFFSVQPLDRPQGRVFFIVRNRETNGTTDGQVEQRAGWSYRSWVNDPGENTAITNAVSFTITSSNVSAKSRKILAATTIEVSNCSASLHA